MDICLRNKDYSILFYETWDNCWINGVKELSFNDVTTSTKVLRLGMLGLPLFFHRFPLRKLLFLYCSSSSLLDKCKSFRHISSHFYPLHRIIKFTSPQIPALLGWSKQFFYLKFKRYHFIR